jgi:hypothetical protein
MTQLFCTPEQGQRLKELLPELTSGYYYVRLNEDIAWDVFPNGRSVRKYEHVPALTLQELREDILLRFKPFTTCNIGVLKKAVWDYTAPELAEWVIERLEAQL